MTAATLPLTDALTAKRLRALLSERGLKLMVYKRDEIVARWPVAVARVTHQGRRVAVLKMNDRSEWRGVLMVGNGTSGYDLIAQENRFRDLSHVLLWIEFHTPHLHPEGTL